MILIENVKGWGKMFDAFNQCDERKICIKNGGKGIEEVLERWLIANYDIPMEYIIPKEDEHKYKIGYKK